MLQDFLVYLKSKVGAIYVLGAQGQHGAQITEAWIKYREHNKAANYKRAIALWKKKTAQGEKDIWAFDCSGLGMYWLIKSKVFSGDKNANGMKGTCKKITRAALKKGDWVFRVTLGRAHHIGYVVDDALNVVECKGRDYGVVMGHVDKIRGYWNYFGRPKCFEKEIEAAAANKPGESLPILKTGDKGSAVEKLQKLLNAKGASLEADGVFGPKTLAAVIEYQKKNKLEIDGVVGPLTWGSLMG